MVKVKKTRMMIIGLFVLMGILFNITVYFDNGGAQDSDFALSDLRVSLVDKAYACGVTSCAELGCWGGDQLCGEYTVGGNGTKYCYWKEGSF